MKKVIPVLFLLPSLVVADYKMYFENKGSIKIPEPSQSTEAPSNPETSSGYLTLVGESDITITASKTYSLDVPEAAFDGYVWEGSTSVEKVIQENPNSHIERGVWISGWYTTEPNNDFLYNQWLDIKFNDGLRDISGFEIWPTKYKLNRAPYHVKIQYSQDNGFSYQDGEEFYLTQNNVIQRKEFSSILKDVKNVRFFIYQNHENTNALQVDELQFF